MIDSTTKFKKGYSKTALFVGVCILSAILTMVVVLKPLWIFASDGFGYYEYLRSVVFDKDLNFYNEGQFFDKEFNITEKNYYSFPTATGYYPNPFAIGTAILETPWFLVAHIYHYASHYPDSSLPGFSPDYAFFINLGNICYGLAGLFITYLFLKKFTRENIALTTAVVLLFATPLIYFIVYEAIWSHLPAFLFVSAFIYYWYQTREAVSYKKYLILGSLVGINFLIRWQNILLLIFLIPDLFNLLKRFKIEVWKRLAVFNFSMFICALPQFLVWKLLYGHFLVKPPSNSSFTNLLSPPVWSFLFSSLHGMLVWHPIYIVSLAGVLYLVFKTPKVGWPFLLFLVAEIYINSAVADWWGGGGGTFGARRMLDYSLIYGLGMAIALKAIMTTRLKSYLATILLCSLIVVNNLLMIQAARGWLYRINPENNSVGLAVPPISNFIVNSKVIVKEFLRLK